MSEDSGRDFQERFGVSRETIESLQAYAALIVKWNKVINLVAKSTVDDLWARHFVDSAEAFKASGATDGNWTDLGTGGGFPGMVAAIMAKELSPNIVVTCIESDIRKCEFLRTVSRATEVKVNILSRRIEESPPQNATVVSARALAPLSKLLGYVERHIANDGVAILLKGENWQGEVEAALETWTFSVENHKSLTHPDSVILKIGDLARA